MKRHRTAQRQSADNADLYEVLLVNGRLVCGLPLMFNSVR
ncbi:Unknown protein sequence [Pseudomonas syringae pv. maculicola]|nr:Unknown protein sequence [Pseudomonas syringae pv. maculicola]